MAGDSGFPFTVTVGSNGRVVKRSSNCSDGRGSGSGSVPVLGSKRTMKNRLETRGNDSSDDRNHYKNKRQKEESNQASWDKSVSNDACLGKGDLRYKILKKNLSRESQEMDQPSTVDLRHKLSRKNNLSLADSRSHPSETTHDTRKNMLDPRDSYNSARKSVVEHRTYDGEKQITRGPRDAYVHQRKSGQEFRDAYADERQSIVREPGNAYNHGRQGMWEPRDSCDCGKQCVLEEPRESYDCGRQDGLGIVPPPSRTGSNLTAVDLVRNPPSPWALENLRPRSPDRILPSSIPPPYFPERNGEEIQKVTMINPYGDGNTNLYRRNGIPSPPRAAGSGAFLMHPASHAVSSFPATRPMPLVAQYPQMSGFAHKVSYIVEQPTVIGFLQSLGLEKYAINFMAEEVDFNALRQMSDADLKELNIPMGPRKKIIQALTPQLRR